MNIEDIRKARPTNEELGVGHTIAVACLDYWETHVQYIQSIPEAEWATTCHARPTLTDHLTNWFAIVNANTDRNEREAGRQEGLEQAAQWLSERMHFSFAKAIRALKELPVTTKTDGD